jgi:hypothetical protein
MKLNLNRGLKLEFENKRKTKGNKTEKKKEKGKKTIAGPLLLISAHQDPHLRGPAFIPHRGADRRVRLDSRASQVPFHNSTPT